MNQNQPIFIHSLFRAGSTYIFKVFRESPAGYTAYQEPLHEELNCLATQPEKLLVHHQETSKRMRHPTLDKPYFYEFYLLKDKIAPLYRKEFSFDEFFPAETDDISALMAYITALAEGAEKRPVFQCCRSTGRAKRCRAECGGVHLFLWRNPWDQWWSYQLGFEPYNLLILNAKNPPPILQQIRDELGVPEIHSPDVLAEYAHYRQYVLTPQQSYEVFYALWCHAMLETLPACDLSINIDHLSVSPEYQAEILAGLKQWEVEGLDFSDCSSPRGVYEKPDIEFFTEIEQKVHARLLATGYTQAQVDEMLRVRAENYPPITDPAELLPAALRDATRARELTRKYETALHEAASRTLARKKYLKPGQRVDVAAKPEAAALQDELEYIWAELAEAQAQRAEIQSRLDAVWDEKENLKKQMDLIWLEREKFRLRVVELLNSTSYRATAPLRWATDVFRALRQKVSGRVTAAQIRVRQASKRFSVTARGQSVLGVLRRVLPGLWGKIIQYLDTEAEARAELAQRLANPKSATKADEEYFAALFNQENKPKP